MQDDMIMYVRNRQFIPVGATYFKNTGATSEGKDVVVMGWSKAYKSDTFTKKFGRSVAIKRADKAKHWILGSDRKKLDITTVDNISDTNIPFIIKENLSYYLDTVKDSFGIEDDAIFVLPVVEKYVDIASAMKDAIVKDSGFVDTSKSKVTTKTRYITLQY